MDDVVPCGAFRWATLSRIAWVNGGLISPDAPAASNPS